MAWHNDIPHFNKELSDEIHAVPLWVALRWLVVCLLRGPERADKYIREEDRP